MLLLEMYCLPGIRLHKKIKFDLLKWIKDNSSKFIKSKLFAFEVLTLVQVTHKWKKITLAEILNNRFKVKEACRFKI